MLKILTIFVVYCSLAVVVTVLAPTNTATDNTVSQCMRATKIYCDVESLTVHK